MPEIVAKTQNPSVPDFCFEFTIPSLMDFVTGYEEEKSLLEVCCSIVPVCPHILWNGQCECCSSFPVVEDLHFFGGQMHN